VSIGSWGDAEAADQYLRLLKDKIAEFEERLSDRLPPARKDLLKLLLDRAPRLIKRTDSRRAGRILKLDQPTTFFFARRWLPSVAARPGQQPGSRSQHWRVSSISLARPNLVDS
jgi:hypothetical protein